MIESKTFQIRLDTVLHGAYIEHTMKRTNIHLTDQQRAKLAKLARKTGLTVAELVRRAVDAFLKAAGKQ